MNLRALNQQYFYQQTRSGKWSESESINELLDKTGLLVALNCLN